jgi:hypothetical protein
VIGAHKEKGADQKHEPLSHSSVIFLTGALAGVSRLAGRPSPFNLEQY